MSGDEYEIQSYEYKYLIFSSYCCIEGRSGWLILIGGLFEDISCISGEGSTNNGIFTWSDDSTIIKTTFNKCKSNLDDGGGICMLNLEPIQI